MDKKNFIIIGLSLVVLCLLTLLGLQQQKIHDLNNYLASQKLITEAWIEQYNNQEIVFDQMYEKLMLYAKWYEEATKK